MANETMQWPNPGLGSVGSYQMGGIPYLSSSIIVPPSGAASFYKAQFPYVTKFVTIVNTGSSPTAPNFRVGFSTLGISGSNFFTLGYGESYTGEWRIEDIYLISTTNVQSSATIIAGLTPIPRGIPAITGSGNNWSGSVGVG